MEVVDSSATGDYEKEYKVERVCKQEIQLVVSQKDYQPHLYTTIREHAWAYVSIREHTRRVPERYSGHMYT